MNNTFIKMLAAIEDPAAIERAYQMMAAKRDLLARNAEKTCEFNLRYGDEKGFAHLVREPRPVFDTKCADKVDMHHKATFDAALEKAGVTAAYKLAPSMKDIQFVKGLSGAFRLAIFNATDDMQAAGFNNGDLFDMEKVGYERSTVRSSENIMRTARVHNRYLRVVFVTKTGGRLYFAN